MPTLDLSQEYNVFDNPEVLILINPAGDTATTNYGYRRAITVAYHDQSGVMKVENMTKFLVWKTNITPLVPQIDCEITDSQAHKYFVNGVDNQGNQEYYALDCTRKSS